MDILLPLRLDNIQDNSAAVQVYKEIQPSGLFSKLINGIDQSIRKDIYRLHRVCLYHQNKIWHYDNYMHYSRVRISLDSFRWQE